jgi:hypothetical protein
MVESLQDMKLTPKTKMTFPRQRPQEGSHVNAPSSPCPAEYCIFLLSFTKVDSYTLMFVIDCLACANMKFVQWLVMIAPLWLFNLEFEPLHGEQRVITATHVVLTDIPFFQNKAKALLFH